MTVYTYVSNKDSSDHTGIVVFRNGAATLKIGQWLDITLDELAALSTRFNMVEGQIGSGGQGAIGQASFGLAQLADVDLTGLTDNQFLIWDASASKWKLRTAARGKIDAWAASTSYTQGQLVQQGGQIYSALADFTSGGAFSLTNWRQVIVGPDLGAMTMPQSAIFESIPRSLGIEHVTTGGTAGSPLVSGQAQGLLVSFAKGDIVNQVKLAIGSTASASQTSATAIITDATGVVLAVSDDRGSTVLAADFLNTFNFSTPWTCPSDGNYYIYFLVVATTMPSSRGRVSHSSITGQTPRSCVRDSTTGRTGPPSVGATLTNGLIAFQPYISVF